jgi:hypothetical protein
MIRAVQIAIAISNIFPLPSAPALQAGHQIFGQKGRREVCDSAKGHQTNRDPYPKGR